MPRQVLFLLTSQFPYGKGEAFLESEVPYLAEAFDEVIIVTNDMTTADKRPTADNVSVVRLPYSASRLRLKTIIATLWSGHVWEELLRLLFTYRLAPSVARLRTIFGSWRNAKRIARNLRQLLRQRTSSDDAVIAYSYWCDDNALALAMMPSYMRNIKRVSRVHRWDVYLYAHSSRYLPFRSFIAKRLDYIISISNDGADYIRTKWKVGKPANLHVSRLGIGNSSEPVTPTPPPYVVFSCSNLIPVKRVNLIIEALCLIRDITIRWIHIGDGPQGPSLQRLAMQRLGGNIQWRFMGALTNSEVFELYRQHQPCLFLNLSASEGVPVSIMEAISFGVPVIATDVGGNREIVNEQTGNLLEAHPESEQVAEAITQLMRLPPEQCHRLRRTTREFWELNYNAEVNYPGFVRHLKSLMELSAEPRT